MVLSMELAMVVSEKPPTVESDARFTLPRDAQPWPASVELILSAIETGQFTRRERRLVNRISYRVQARLKLFSDGADELPRVLYTRDIDPRGLGFITPHRLPLGYGGLLEIIFPDGRVRNLPATIYRCREAAPGWFEGALHFNRYQPELEG